MAGGMGLEWLPSAPRAPHEPWTQPHYQIQGHASLEVGLSAPALPRSPRGQRPDSQAQAGRRGALFSVLTTACLSSLGLAFTSAACGAAASSGSQNRRPGAEGHAESAPPSFRSSSVSTCPSLPGGPRKTGSSTGFPRRNRNPQWGLTPEFPFSSGRGAVAGLGFLPGQGWN